MKRLAIFCLFLFFPFNGFSGPDSLDCLSVFDISIPETQPVMFAQSSQSGSYVRGRTNHDNNSRAGNNSGAGWPDSNSGISFSDADRSNGLRVLGAPKYKSKEEIYCEQLISKSETHHLTKEEIELIDFCIELINQKNRATRELYIHENEPLINHGENTEIQSEKNRATRELYIYENEPLTNRGENLNTQQMHSNQVLNHGQQVLGGTSFRSRKITIPSKFLEDTPPSMGVPYSEKDEPVDSNTNMKRVSPGVLSDSDTNSNQSYSSGFSPDNQLNFTFDKKNITNTFQNNKYIQNSQSIQNSPAFQSIQNSQSFQSFQKSHNFQSIQNSHSIQSIQNSHNFNNHSTQSFKP